MEREAVDQWQFGEFRLDVRRKVLRHRGVTVAVPPKELDLLCMLVRQPGELVTKDELFDEIWEDSYVEESNLSRHVYLLRKTLRDLGADEGLIENVPRRGYKFTGEVRAVEADEVVLERRTHTRTMIEFPNEARPRTRGGLARMIALSCSVALLIVVAAILAYKFAGNAQPVGEIRSLAVLPFRTIGADGPQSNSGMGLTDVLITRLSNIRDLKVRPTTSVVAFEDQDPAAAGEKLQVDALLEGAVLYSGERVRVTARLIRTADNQTMWTGEFEKLRSDELQLQNELALQIVKTLAVELSGSERDGVDRRYTDSVDAYELYARGRHEWNKRTGPAMVEAARLFRNAIAADPNFALAYVGLADTIALNRHEMTETEAAIARALELDPNLAEPHATRGFLLMFYERDWEAAEAAFKRSLELKPNYATAHHWYATLHAIQGKTGEAKLEMHRALEIDPLSHNFIADLGQIHYFAGEYDEAERHCLRALELYPDFAFAHQYLYYIYLKTGNHDRAIEEIIKVERIINTLNNAPATQEERLQKAEAATRKAYQQGGIVGYLERNLGTVSNDPETFYFYAIKYTLKGENEKALDYLERSTDLKMFLSAFVKADPIFERLHAEPRYQQILRKMRLG
jgi:DNA-binding winged helix-turn-helix (wHTH) protein/TolB-like protein/Tfp pilus assembly protein PilF